MATLSRRIVPALVLLALLAAGCTRRGGNVDGTAPPPTTPPPTESPLGPIGTTPGTYEYRNAGLVAVLVFDDGGPTASLEIENGTGRDLGKPDVYVLDARDGHEIDGRVPDAAPIADGGTGRFTVEFPDELEVDQIGLAILLIGGDNYGAFVPK